MNIITTNRTRLLVLVLIMYAGILKGQSGGCIFKDTILRIDFGNQARPQEFNLRSLRDYYQRDYSNCPPDGYYSYSTLTSDCFNGDWITLTEDHTANDNNGRMFFVNANPNSAVFFIADLAGFKPNTTYEFGLWMMNLCKVNGGCTPLPPNILITLESSSGDKLASFKTGLIVSSPTPYWKKYFGTFTTTADIGIVHLKMQDMTNGGCGNDFVMDDITLRECYKTEPPPVVKTETKPPVITPKPVIKETQAPDVKLKKDTLDISKVPVKNDPKAPTGISKIKPVNISLPEVIRTRENPIIKKIETVSTEMLIELYDNGQIDGDTVSIYHNNELVVSHAGLSEKPISFKIKVDAKDPHHELIMVADNLGSIPPNTSLMVITAKGKRYEIFISSSEQKNAKLIIDLKE